MIVYPNAKLNLGLSILGKRSDGFHDIETLYIPYKAKTDELEIDRSERFETRIGGTWSADEDITVKAYRMLSQAHRMPPVKIRLIKGIPVGSGLGGGSSDAVAALKMLNEMFSLNLSEEKLLEFASRLGSDCPFFVHNRPMLGTGRGDVLTPYEIDLSDYDIKVLVPEGIRINTKEAYEGVPEHEGMPLLEALAHPVEQWKDVLVNDFERSIFLKYPRLAKLKQDFYDKGAVYASMTGSGSAIFGLFRKEGLFGKD